MIEIPLSGAFSLRLSPAAPFREDEAGRYTPANGFPTSLHDQPVRYAWKEAIRAGRYVHPATGQSLDVTPERIDRWLLAFRRMKANGVKVYVPVNHSARTEDNRGYVLDARREGGRLRLLHQLIGEDACRDAARSEVSLRIVPNLCDGLGRSYGEAIEHSSLVVDPVVPGQRPFEAIAASRGEGGDGAPDGGGADVNTPVFVLSDSNFPPPTPTPHPPKGADMTASSEQVAAVRDLIQTYLQNLSRGYGAEAADPPPPIPEADAVTADNAFDVLTDLARRLGGRLDHPDAPPPPTADEPTSPPPPQPDEAMLALLSRSLQTEREAAVGCGAISPACARDLDQLLTENGRPTALALSRTAPADGETTPGNTATAGEPLVFQLWSILRRNRPVDLGQRSGVQTLARVAPADESANGSPSDGLPYSDMAAHYNRRRKV